MTIYRFFRIDSQTAWAIECNGQIIRTHPSAAVLGAYLDSILAGATEYDADDIAKAIERQPSLSYEERMAMFRPMGRSEPSRVLFANHGDEVKTANHRTAGPSTFGRECDGRHILARRLQLLSLHHER